MKNNCRHTPSASRQVRQQPSSEKGTNAFYAELQKAVNEVDWGKVKLPELRDQPALNGGRLVGGG